MQTTTTCKRPVPASALSADSRIIELKLKNQYICCLIFLTNIDTIISVSALIIWVSTMTISVSVAAIGQILVKTDGQISSYHSCQYFSSTVQIEQRYI